MIWLVFHHTKWINRQFHKLFIILDEGLIILIGVDPADIETATLISTHIRCHHLLLDGFCSHLTLYLKYLLSELLWWTDYWFLIPPAVRWLHHWQEIISCLISGAPKPFEEVSFCICHRYSRLIQFLEFLQFILLKQWSHWVLWVVKSVIVLFKQFLFEGTKKNKIVFGRCSWGCLIIWAWGCV